MVCSWVALLLCSLAAAAVVGEQALYYDVSKGMCFDNEDCTISCSRDHYSSGYCALIGQEKHCFCKNYDSSGIGECLRLTTGAEDHQECKSRCQRQGWKAGSCLEDSCHCNPYLILNSADTADTIPPQKKLYFNESIKLNWFDANDKCQEMGMLLAAVETPEEQKRIEALIKPLMSSDTLKYSGVWTSGSDLGHTGHYVWMSSGRNITYFNWSPRQPTGTWGGVEEHCIELWETKEGGRVQWNDDDCSKEQHFVCEYNSTTKA